MDKAALWHQFQQLSVRATHSVIQVGAAFSLPFIAAGVSVPSIVHADSVEPVAARTPQACQEQFLLDRRDQPQLALQRLRQCDAIHDASASLDEFTLWYITLPAKSAPEQNTWFATIWRNKLRALTSPPISLSRQDAIGVLDDGVVRALKRGKREELSSRWLTSHDPAIFAPSGFAEAHGQIHDTQVTQSWEIAAPPSPQGELPAKVSASHSGPRPHHTHPSRPVYRYEAPDSEASTNELNRVQAANDRSLSGRSFYAAPAYYLSGVQPQPYPAHSSNQEPPSSSYQQPYPAPVPQQPTYAAQQHQASTAPSSQPASLPLPLQIEANVRMILEQVRSNIQNFEQAVSRQLRGY